MTTAQVVQFFDASPFVPFVFTLANGREVQVMRRSEVSIGRYVQVVAFNHPTRQLEVLDVEHIVSLRTVFPVNTSAWIG